MFVTRGPRWWPSIERAAYEAPDVVCRDSRPIRTDTDAFDDNYLIENRGAAAMVGPKSLPVQPCGDGQSGRWEFHYTTSVVMKGAVTPRFGRASDRQRDLTTVHGLLSDVTGSRMENGRRHWTRPLRRSRGRQRPRCGQRMAAEPGHLSMRTRTGATDFENLNRSDRRSAHPDVSED